MAVFLRCHVHRWYEAGTGRYTRPDPLGPIEQGRMPENTYGYAADNPLFFTDPLGLASRWYAPGVVYNSSTQPVCAVFSRDSAGFDCLVVKPGGLSNPLKDADFVLVPATCEWIKIGVGIATVRPQGTLYLPPSSRFSGGGTEASTSDGASFDKACGSNCECKYCGGS